MLAAEAREVRNFDNDWLFILADSAQMRETGYNDSHWRALDLPHDWAIEGDFLASNPSGAGGGALPGGIGWYRKHFQVDGATLGKTLTIIEFDGVYMNSTVYVNGHDVGTRPYGYSSFQYNITPYLVAGENVIAVKVDNSDQPNSRWYSGCGIYRHVWLTARSNVHVAHWGVYVTTTAKGDVNVEVNLVDEKASGAKAVLRHAVVDAAGKVVATTSSRIAR